MVIKQRKRVITNVQFSTTKIQTIEDKIRYVQTLNTRNPFEDGSRR